MLATDTEEIVCGRPTGKSTSSDDTWELVKGWISECQATHTRCRDDFQNHGWYPTRLVDIGDMQEYRSIIRVVLSKDHNMVGSYVTLSYRWGLEKTLELRRENFETLQEGIPFAGYDSRGETPWCSLCLD